MDKYEYKLKMDQMKTLAGEGDYETAAQIADTLNWRKIKNVNSLIKAGDIYEKAGRYEESRDVLLMAYDRSPIGRMIIYRLGEVSVKMGNLDEAEEYYDEFIEIAPHDNLKYVLRYKISRAKGEDLQTQIAILEELKELEYTEEWAFELAHLYHQAGESDKCTDACDELILWFGEGPYVERALELKMLYQPLTLQQEQKYQMLKQKQDEPMELYPDENSKAVQAVQEELKEEESFREEEVILKEPEENPERFNTADLQEELKKSMQQIMEATEKETVSDTMDSIKKLVEEIPYLQMPPQVEEKEEIRIQQDEETIINEIDTGLEINFKKLLAEESDGQISLFVPERKESEPQITGQMSIQDVLTEWEKTKRAAEELLEQAEQKKLENAKERALKEAEDIMARLADVIPKLEQGISPSEFLKDSYKEFEEERKETDGPELTDEERAGRIVAGMNQVLQQQIDKLQDGKTKEVQKTVSSLPNEKIPIGKFDEQIGLHPYVPPQFLRNYTEMSKELTDNINQSTEPYTGGTFMNETEHEEYEAEKEVLPKISMPSDTNKVLIKQDTKKLKSEEVSRALEKQFDRIRNEQEDVVPGEHAAITTLSEEQKAIFSYFVPVSGMENQICQVLTGAAQRLSRAKNSAAGNIIIQGGRGCGKTVLATSLIKALQKEAKKPNGKIGKIDAQALNRKDIAALLKKVSGGCLIIERAGDISREAAVKLSLLLENDTSGILIIMEDTRAGVTKALSQDEGFARKFTEKITIPVFTSDELVAFGKAYANDLDYEIDEMGVLALYNRISNIQRVDRATTLTEVKEIVDGAIDKAEKGGLKKAFSILTSRRYNDDDFVILREKDFEE